MCGSGITYFSPFSVTFLPSVTSRVAVYPGATKGNKEKRWEKRTKSKQFLEQISVFIVLSPSPSATVKVIMQPF